MKINISLQVLKLIISDLNASYNVWYHALDNAENEEEINLCKSQMLEYEKALFELNVKPRIIKL